MNTKINLNVSANNEENYISLSWNNLDKEGRYSYKIYSKKSTEEKFHIISAKEKFGVQNDYRKDVLDGHELSANALFYIEQEIEKTSWDDYSGQDIDGPEKPFVTDISYDNNSDSITVNYVCNDKGTTYDYYIEATDLEANEKIKSEVKSATITTGIKEYIVSIDNKEDTIPSGNIVTNAGTYTFTLDKVEFKDIYIHIEAVDNAGNISEVCHYKEEYSKINDKRYKIRLKVHDNNKENFISLRWENADSKGRYSYMIYSRTDDEKEFQSIPAKSNIKVLNVYPDCGNNLKGWMESPNYEDENGYGKGFISVDEVNINDFNVRPHEYLKNSDGNWKYDVLYVGAWDSNNNRDYSQDAVNVIDEFINCGRGFLAAHDFFTESTITGIPLSKYEDIIPECIGKGYGSDYIRINKKGMLTNYPWKIGELGGILHIPFSHTSQFSYGDVWMKYPENKWSAMEEISEYKGKKCTNNFYLSTWNNTAMIQTGHSNGYATRDEQKLLANTLFYLAQVTEEVSWDDHKGQDIQSPGKPEINEVSYNKDNNTLSMGYVPSSKKGTTYYYYVEATNLDTNEKTKSAIKKVTITSKFKGYMINVDNNADTIPSGNIVTKSREYTVSLNGVRPGKRYIHISGVDEAGNVSEACHYKFSD